MTQQGNSKLETTLEGVGARHKETGIELGGVGYQDNYTNSGFSKNEPIDPRFAELRGIGLAREWIDIAEAIGFDAFLLVWERLDSFTSEKTEKRHVFVPGFRRWLRFQRNRVILSLRGEGMSPVNIQAKIRQDLGEEVSVSHISRLYRAPKD